MKFLKADVGVIMMKKIFLMMMTILLTVANSADAAEHFVKPRLLIAEIANYGVNELKHEVAANLYYALEKNLSEDFNIESRQLLANLGGEPIADTSIFSTIHMDAVAHGSLYRRELVNSNVKNYADSVVGLKNAKKNSKRKSDGKAYKLTASISPRVTELGKIYGVDYLLFCDVRDADALRKNSNLTVNNLRGKKVKVEMEYYLVNVKTGKVFEGQTFDRAINLDTNAIAKSYGKKFGVDDVVNFVMERHAQQIEKNIDKKALKAVGA